MDEDAKFYQEHKDDSEVWGDAEESVDRKPDRRRLNAMVSVRLTPEEEDALRAEAEKRGVSLSALVRETVLRELTPRSSMDLFDYLKKSTESARSASELHIEGHVVTSTGHLKKLA